MHENWNKKFGVLIIAFCINFGFTEALTGGKFAKPGEFPHAVQLSLARKDGYFCGGSILSSTAILTHCLYFHVFDLDLAVKKPVNSIIVTAGSVNLLEEQKVESGEKEQIVTVNNYVIHPEFNKIFKSHDVALLFLNQPLKFTQAVQPIQLPRPDATFFRGTVAGWGITDWRNVSSPQLKKLDLELKDEACEKQVVLKHGQVHFVKAEICFQENSKDGFCMGDSGSSLICQQDQKPFNPTLNKNKLRLPVICGIALRGQNPGICGESKPEANIVFLDVSKYSNWIQYTMKTEREKRLRKGFAL